MNIKTTLALVIVLASGAGLAWTGLTLPASLDPMGARQAVSATDADSRAILAELKPADIRRIDILRGKEKTTLIRVGDGSWVMPGNWRTRTAEVKHLLDEVGKLHSRFAPIAVAEADLADYGLDKPPVTVVVKTGSGEHRLAFADAITEEDTTRFDRPTYLRVDDKPEVHMLGPGWVAMLERPADYYQLRRLFPSERVDRDDSSPPMPLPPEEGSSTKEERVVATRIEVREQGKLKFAIVKGRDGWELSEPTRDALDPSQRNTILKAIPDLWAERFLAPEKAKSLADLGLKEPERVLAVTGPDGAVVTLEIGKPTLAAPPANWSYAKLKGFDRVFEIKADKLNDIFVSLDALRDNQLARFKREDAREVEITTRKGRIVLRNHAPLAKPDDKIPPKSDWKLSAPVSAGADSALVDRLLTTLSGLSVIDKDLAEKIRKDQTTTRWALPALVGAQAGPVSQWLLDPATLQKTSGLNPPAATVKVTVEESKGKGVEDKDKPRTRRTVTIQLGRHDKIGKKLFARSQDWPRINEIDDSLAELVLDKSAMDYRGRRLLDFLALDVDRIEVRRLDLPALGAGLFGLVGGMPGYSRLGAITALAADRTMHLALHRSSIAAGDAEHRQGWGLTAPVKAEADAGKVNDLADRLGKLEVLGFVADKASEVELQGRYGLGVPALSVTVSFSDKQKTPKTLHIGRSRIRLGEPGFFARLEGSPEIFAVGSDLYDLLDRDSLAYRQATLWQIDAGDEIAKLRIHKAGQQEYSLVRKGEDWQVTGPFTVAAPSAVVDKLTAALRSPKVEEYLAHAVADQTLFGLDKPEVQVMLTTKKGKEHSLRIGNRTEHGAIGRIARLGGGGSAVFVVGDALARTVDQSALDFLDRGILKFDSGAVTSFTRKQGEHTLELVKKDEAWEMVKPSAQRADEKKVPELLRGLADLRAVRIAAFKPTALVTFGLDKPDALVTIKLGGAAKPNEYVLEIGKQAPGRPGDRYARVKGGDTVAVLPGDVVGKLLAGPLAYRDHSLARLPDADAIKLESGERKATFSKPEGSWKLSQPIAAEADHDAIEGFLNSLARLRADELVAEKPTADQLKGFGLEKPIMRWQFIAGDKVALDLSIGKIAESDVAKGGLRRYARLAGKDLVFLLDPKLSGQVVAEYRPRAVFKDNIDPAQIEAVRFGYRKDAFELKKVDGAWEVVGKPDAKVDAKLVSDTLSVLRDLKLQRYILDTGAQLKLFGLDPPELVLEVTTPAGKHTLHIGGLEGASRRRYARVPVKGTADVFVLDELASSKLFRDLAALTKLP